MKNIFATLVMMVLALALLAPSAFAQVVKLIPQPDFEPGWQWDFEPEIYTPDNLFEYIDGEAELYNDYHFKEMVTASYARKDNEAITFTIDIYDMGTPLNAFGIYSSFRRPQLTFDKIGEEAIVSDLNIRFYKGRHFVQLNAGSTDELVRTTIRKLALKLADTIPAAEQPSELSLLPTDGQMPHSLKYITKGFMGQALFKQSLQADYKLASGECTGFVVIFKDDKAAIDALKAFEASLRDRGTIKTSLKETGNVKFIASEQYMGNILVQQNGRYIVGVKGYKDEKEAEGLVEKIITCIKKSAKSDIK